MTTAQLIALLFRVGITLGVMVGVCALIVVLIRRRSDNERHRGFFRGSCRDCGYNPDTGTRTCPECGGPVLDLRLFRPIADAAPDAVPADTPEPEVMAGTDHGAHR